MTINNIILILYKNNTDYNLYKTLFKFYLSNNNKLKYFCFIYKTKYIL